MLPKHQMRGNAGFLKKKKHFFYQISENSVSQGQVVFSLMINPIDMEPMFPYEAIKSRSFGSIEFFMSPVIVT